MNKEVLAKTLIKARLQKVSSLPPLTTTHPTLTLSDGYEIGEVISNSRIQEHHDIIRGFKVGFTNRATWAAAGITEPFWSPMYGSTIVNNCSPSHVIQCNISEISQARIEPEIVFQVNDRIGAAKDRSQLMDAIEGVTFGYEIVQCPYPLTNAVIRAADAVAAAGLHARLYHGAFYPVDRHLQEQLEEDFSVTLKNKEGSVGAVLGKASNVFGGPLEALWEFIQIYRRTGSTNRELSPGDIITTGSLTAATGVKAGETWTTELHGINLVPLSMKFTESSKL